MHIFPIHSLETAPEKSRPALQALQSAFGFVPNIAGAMATSPVLIDSLVGLFGKVHGGSFTEAEIQTLLLTNAVTNAADWAVAFHSLLALKNGLNADDVEAMRRGQPPKEPRLAALSQLARTLIEKRGRINDRDGERFLAQGFAPEHLLEVVAVVAASTITNYTAGIAEPPLEAEFQPHAWKAFEA